jgi:L-iditol 2-dehydrogenase
MGSPIQTLPISVAANREVDLLGVWRYVNCYARGIEIMQMAAKGQGIPDIRKMITHRFNGLDSVPAAFDAAASTKDADGNLIIKTVVEM